MLPQSDLLREMTNEMRAGRDDAGKMTEAAVRLRDQPSGSGPTCRRILRALPTWFGIPQSVEDYVDFADRTPTTVASIGGENVGFLTVLRHNPYSAEIYVMGVLPEHHRHGIGRSMVKHAEDSLARDGVEFLQVKTLSSVNPDAGYQKTRAFYLACGFRPLQEFGELWGPRTTGVADGEGGRSGPGVRCGWWILNTQRSCTGRDRSDGVGEDRLVLVPVLV
jgi:GNAT superfamily N-acetyltransferase